MKGNEVSNASFKWGEVKSSQMSMLRVSLWSSSVSNCGLCPILICCKGSVLRDLKVGHFVFCCRHPQNPKRGEFQSRAISAFSPVS